MQEYIGIYRDMQNICVFLSKVGRPTKPRRRERRDPYDPRSLCTEVTRESEGREGAQRGKGRRNVEVGGTPRARKCGK